MLSFKLNTNDLDEYLIRTQRSLQKTLRRAINTGVKSAYKEGYKMLRDKLKLKKDEYRSKTTVKKLKLSHFRRFRPLTASIRSSKKGIGLIRFAKSKRRTQLKNIRTKRRKKVVIDLESVSQSKARFITKRRNSKQNQVFSKYKVNKKWKWKREQTKSIADYLLEDETLKQIYKSAQKKAEKIIDIPYFAKGGDYAFRDFDCDLVALDRGLAVIFCY